MRREMLGRKKSFELSRKHNRKHHQETKTSWQKEIAKEEEADKILHSNGNKGKENQTSVGAVGGGREHT